MHCLALYVAVRYSRLMIRNFKCAETQKIFEGVRSKKLPSNIQHIVRRKLRMLNNAFILNDLLIPPTNMLEKLGGNRKGQHSIRITKQWHICFIWTEGVIQVEIVDYH